MKPGTECSEKPVLPGFSEENQALKAENPDFSRFSEEKGVFETENPVFRIRQKHGSHPYVRVIH